MPDEKLQAAISQAVKQAAGWWPFGGQQKSLTQAPAAPLPVLPKPVSPLASRFNLTPKSTTLGSQIGRWYQNAGGLDKAISGAQQAQQQRNPAVLNDALWPKWQSTDVTKRTSPVTFAPPDKNQTDASWWQPGAAWNWDTNHTWINQSGSTLSNNKKNQQAMLEHELGHAAYIRDADTANRIAAEHKKQLEYDPTNPDDPKRKQWAGVVKAFGDDVRTTDDYLSLPYEVDVRLAEIKRRYAAATGKLVDTPDAAQQAWEWWRNEGQKLWQNPPNNYETDRPTMGAEDFNYYDTWPEEGKQQLFHRMPELVQQPNQAVQKFGAAVKQADLKPEIILQPHQQRVADRVSGPNPRMLVYHGLGTGKSLAAIAAAEAAKKNSGGEYAIVAPASLRDNFRKEIDKFTTGSSPDILSYTGLGLGQTPKNNPETLIFDEAHRLRNPEGLAAQAATEAAQKVPRVVLLTGSPITNEPSDLANIMSILRNEKITPESFENKYVQYKKVKPGWGGWLRGVKPGEEADVKNPEELKSKLRGHVDFNPGKSPDGVNINQQIIDAPMTAEQERIQKAIRTKIPPRFLWKLDKEFPLSREELSKLNSFLTGMRQISLSTQPFRADKDHFKAFEQSGKLQTALTKLRETLDSDPRKKALIYSNYIDAGLQPYAAALAKNKIPHAIFHGGIPLSERRKALDEYNAGKLKALLIGPAGAEGISTKGTSLIQLLDPHWNETRSQQAQGRGLRFDSHMDLPEELKNVAVQRFISRAKDPGWFQKRFLGAQKIRTGDEILDTLAKEKEKANDKFRAILKQVGSESQQEEVARRMYEENVPEEQQRKAASETWLKMQKVLIS